MDDIDVSPASDNEQKLSTVESVELSDFNLPQLKTSDANKNISKFRALKSSLTKSKKLETENPYTSKTSSTKRMIDLKNPVDSKNLISL